MKLNLLFALDSSQLTREDKDKVAEFAEFMHLNSTATVVIKGHTDARGSDAYNLWLSQKRADAVANLLINTHGIDAQRLSTIGYGETQLLNTGNSESAHAVNRRTVAEITMEQQVFKNK